MGSIPARGSEIFFKEFTTYCTYCQLKYLGVNQRLTCRGLLSKETVLLHWQGVEMNVWFKN